MAPAATRCLGQGQGTLEINTHYLGQLNLIIVDNASTYMSPELYLHIGYSIQFMQSGQNWNWKIEFGFIILKL